MSIETIHPGLRVARADNPGPLTLDGTRSYLVGSVAAALIDPGPPGDEQQRLLEELIGDRTVRFVCLTHSHGDHAGAAPEIAARHDCEIAASAETLRRIGVEGRALADGDQLRLEGPAPAAGGHELRLLALATPGHTRDHMSFLGLPDRELFTGDLVLGSGTSVILHPDGQIAEYLASLERLIAQRPEIILPGHGAPVEGPDVLMREYIAHRLERERQIEEALDAGARSVTSIRARVYGPLPPGIDRAADASIRAHLAHIEKRRGGLSAVDGYSGATGAADVTDA